MPGLDFFLRKTMAKVNLKINKEQLLLDLSKRISENENGVRSFLQTAGVSVNPKVGITLVDLRALKELNPESFNSMIKYLYPEQFPKNADADGAGGEGGTGASGLSQQTQDGIIGLFGNLISTAGDTFKDIYGSATPKALLQYSQEQAARTRRILIIVGILGVALLVTVLVIKYRSSGINLIKA